MEIVVNNGQYHVYNKVRIDKLFAPRNYMLDYDCKGNCFIKEAPEFSIPKKIYDVERPFREQVIKSFNHFERNLGVVLEGYKGQGKSINAMLLCKELKLPVIMITKPIPIGIDFVSYLNTIEQSYIIFVDEFEKNFHKKQDDDKDFHSQSSFLSMMDGSLSSEYKKLFLFTANSSICDHIVNRPSRVRYYKSYEFMDEKLQAMIIEDRLIDKSFKEDLLNNLPVLDCTVDLVISIIDEINLHKVPYSNFKDVFNHKPRTTYYEREIFDGKEFKKHDTLSTIDVITRTSNHFMGNVITILSYSNEGIVYKTKEWEITDKKDSDGEFIEEHVEKIYRIRKSATFISAF